MLITYADSLGGNLKELKFALDRYFKKALGSVHILPFFPSSADRGFSPMTYRRVDERLGAWDDIDELARDYDLMFDFMINHVSAQSEYYLDYLQKREQSEYRDLFIRFSSFWPGGEPGPAELAAIYKRKPRAPYVTATFADGSQEKLWCTFDEQQIDINCLSETGKEFIRENLIFLAEHGASLIRLDAFAYSIKKSGTSCFFIEPEVWRLLRECRQLLQSYGVEIIPEVHEHYSLQLKLAENGYLPYDFSLPMLLLHALYTGTAVYLKHWFEICPRRQYTTLDTHDGIGVVDVIDLLPQHEIDRTRDLLYSRGANVKRKYSSTEYKNLDIYQINCTYYSALGNDDDLYLMARAVQFFAPGIPQVYYVGLLVGENDIELLETTKNGRDINRHYYSPLEIERDVQRPVVQHLLRLMEFRNEHPAFGGTFELEDCGEHRLVIVRRGNGHHARLEVDFIENRATICYDDLMTGDDVTEAIVPFNGKA